MSTDEKDNDSPGDKKAPPPKQVVVTHYGKKKKDPDVPSEILPIEPTHIISSPVDIGTTRSTTSATSTSTTPDKPVMTEKPIPASSPSPKREEPAFYPDAMYPKEEPYVPPHRASAASKSSEQSSSYGGSYIPPHSGNGDDISSGGRSGGGGGGVFFSLISLVAVSVLGYYGYHIGQQLSVLQQKTSDDQTSVQALSEQTKKSLTQMQALHSKSTQEQASLETLKKQLEGAQLRLISLTGSSDWVLAEANYLAFMANERLHTAHDVTTALAQLNAADERLSGLANPAFLWVREVLAKDIAKLHSFPTINRQELWEELGILSAELNQLHFKRISNDAQELSDSTQDDKSASWKTALRQSWQEFKSLIRITRVQDNNIPLALSEQEQAQILRTMQFMTEQARWAILQGENKIYSASLESLQSWMSQYFVDDKVQKDLLEQLKKLQEKNVEIALPDISNSVQALSKAMIEISNRPTPSRPIQ